MERKFLRSLFYKVEKDVCIKNCTAGKYRRSEKCQKKCQENGRNRKVVLVDFVLGIGYT